MSGFEQYDLAWLSLFLLVFSLVGLFLGFLAGVILSDPGPREEEERHDDPGRWTVCAPPEREGTS